MGCGDFVEDTWDDIEGASKDVGRAFDDYVLQPTLGNYETYGGKDHAEEIFDDIKHGWDDFRGASARKAAEEAARKAEAAREKAATYQRGAKVTARKTEKPGSGQGKGMRGTRLVRQPLGTYQGMA